MALSRESTEDMSAVSSSDCPSLAIVMLALSHPRCSTCSEAHAHCSTIDALYACPDTAENHHVQFDELFKLCNVNGMALSV